MINVGSEQLCLLTKASADVPGSPHTSTLIRWAMRGLRGVRLETVLVGGRRFTSIEAIERFLARLNEPSAVPVPSVSSSRQKCIARANQQLDAEGFTERP
jgi:hypothetical protein